MHTIDKELVIYNAWFYRESEYLPRDWVPDESTLDRDSIGMHKGDLIVLVEWKQNSSVFKYYISIRSKEKKTYGDPIYRYIYINDLLIEIQTYPKVGDYAAEYTYPDSDGDGISNKDEVE